MAGRDETEEGIDKKLAVHYYARWKFLYDLLPALKKASEAGENSAVMSILAAGRGGAIDLEDLALKKGYSVQKAALIAPTYNDLMLEASRYFIDNCILLIFFPFSPSQNSHRTSNSSMLIRESFGPHSFPPPRPGWFVPPASSFSLSFAPSPYRG